MKILKEKSLEINLSDKGGEFCTISKEKYTELGLNHLNDANTYKKYRTITAATIEAKINKTWKEVAAKNNLSKAITYNLTTHNTEIAHIFF